MRDLRSWVSVGVCTLGILVASCSSDDEANGNGASAGNSGDGGSTPNPPGSDPATGGDGDGGGSGDGGSGEGGGGADTPYRNAIMADAPVAYWRLGESSGKVAKDEIGNAHPGTYYGGVQQAVPGITGEDKAASFDGTSGCIGVGQFFRFPGRVAFSVEGWVKISTYGAQGTRIVSTEGFPTGIRSGWNLSASYGDSGFPYFDAWSSEGTDNQYVMGAYSSTSPDKGKLVLNEWNHVVGTFSDAAEEIWVNGVLRNRVRQSTLARPNQGTLTIGCAGNGSRLTSAWEAGSRRGSWAAQRQSLEGKEKKNQMVWGGANDRRRACATRGDRAWARPKRVSRCT